MVSLKYLQKLQEEISELQKNQPLNNGEIEKRPRSGSPNSEDELSVYGGKKQVKLKHKHGSTSIHNDSQPSRDEVNVFNGTSSISLFGLEIKDALPNEAVSKIDFNEHVVSPINNRCDRYTVMRNGLTFTCIFEFEMDNKVTITVQLPQYSHVLECLDMYILYLSGCFYYFNLGQFRTRLYRLYYQPADNNTYSRKDIFFLCQILLVCAVGEMYLRKPDLNVRTRFKGLENFPGIGHFDKAYSLVNMLFDGMTTAHSGTALVEVMMLFSFYHQLLNASSGYYIFSGVCLRAATTMGMHKLDDRYQTDDDKKLSGRQDIEHKRRLWWSIYIIDRYMSAKLGFPISIPEEWIIAELPQDIDPPGSHEEQEEEAGELTEFPPASYMNSFIRVMQISSWILLNLYQPSVYNKKLLPTISSIMSKLNEWRQNVPPELNVDFAANDEAFHISRTVANVYSEYYQCINLTVRPLLLHFTRKRILDKPSNNTYIDISSYSEHILGLLNASLDASVQLIKTHVYLKNHGAYSVYGYLDREYIFSAASTLVMFNVAFSIDRNTQRYIYQALQLLSTSDKNVAPFASARKAQLLNFISAFDFLDGGRLSEFVVGGEGTNSHKEYQALTENTHHHQPSNPVPMTSDERTTPQVPLAPQPEVHQSGSLPAQQFPDQNNSVNHQNYLREASGTFRHEKSNVVPPIFPVVEDILDSGERELWDEISNQGFWLGNVSNEFKTLIDENMP